MRLVPARSYPMQAWFLLSWRGRTFYSTRPIMGLFYLPHVTNQPLLKMLKFLHNQELAVLEMLVHKELKK